MDEDFALALSLQQFENDDDIQEIGMISGVKLLPTDQIGLKENLGHGLTTSNTLAGRPLSIVDETWELIDPVPNIHELFIQFNQAYFEGKLAGVEVRWSPRMTLCAGLCCYEGRGGLCSIRLSEPLLKLRPRKDLVQTLLHEMIHAVLFVTHNNKDHDSHGPEFHKHMYRINKQTGSNITVYHNFHDEVKNYRQHWWKCDGPCQKRAPFFGIVRRAMNRAPSKNDNWWAEHLRTCGGQFKKIKEPEDYGKKGNKRKISEKNTNNSKVDPERNSSDTAVNKSPSLSKWFKPIKELDASNPDNIRERKNDNLDSLKKPLSMFSGNGHRLDSGQSVRSVSKEQWIENLMKKQVGVSGKRQMASGFISAAGPQQKPLKAIVDGAANQKTRVNVVSSSTVSKPGSTHKDNNITGFKQNFTQEVSVMKSKAVNKKCHALPGQNSAPSSSSSFCNTSQSNNQFNGLQETIPRQTVKEYANFAIEKFPSLTVEDACMPVDSRPVTLESIPNTVQSIKTSGPSIGDSESGPKLFWNRKDVKQQDIQTIPIVINDSPPCNQRSTKFVECPACPKLIPENMINAHLDKCLAQAFS